MLFSRIPSWSTLAELAIIAMIIMWIVQDPSGAGHWVSGVIHSIKHGLGQILIFVQNI